MYSIAVKKEQAHSEAIWCCCWLRMESTERDQLITGSVDNKVKVWVWNDIELTHENSLDSHQLGVISIDATPDGSKLVTSSIECSIKLYQTVGWAKLGDIDAGPVDSWTVCLSPDGSKIASGTQHGRINLFSTESLVKEATMKSGEKFIMNVAYSPDGKYLAGASHEGIIYIFDVETSSILHTIEAHAMPIRKVKFSSDSKLLFSAADDKYAKIHSIASAVSLVGTLPGHSSIVTSLDVSPDGKYIASGSADKTVRVWDIGERQSVHKFVEHSDQVWGVAYNHSGSRLASVAEDKSLIIYSIPL